MSGLDAMIEMFVSGVVMEPRSKNPVLVLKSGDGRHLLPVWVGIMEAGAVAAVLEEVVPPRPMTHDLMASMLADLGARMVSVEVTRIENDIFYASIHLDQGGRSLVLDARPSDAVALALRTGAPVMVAEEVIETAGIVVEASLDDGAAQEELQEVLASLPDEVFGKYKM
ncbi:MAG: bifunctional nuclease family protein [Deltaproteobacteria bacterium]|nr:bifunctional nuclease family protein [Deltaproteobacteria bacterium]